MCEKIIESYSTGVLTRGKKRNETDEDLFYLYLHMSYRDKADACCKILGISLSKLLKMSDFDRCYDLVDESAFRPDSYLSDMGVSFEEAYSYALRQGYSRGVISFEQYRNALLAHYNGYYANDADVDSRDEKFYNHYIKPFVDLVSYRDSKDNFIIDLAEKLKDSAKSLGVKVPVNLGTDTSYDLLHRIVDRSMFLHGVTGYDIMVRGGKLEGFFTREDKITGENKVHPRHSKLSYKVRYSGCSFCEYLISHFMDRHDSTCQGEIKTIAPDELVYLEAEDDKNAN